MNKIAYLAAGVAAVERNRARMKKTGATPKGDLLWTKKEEGILRRHARDYQAAIRALGGGRSYNAVRSKARALGLAPKRTHWTGEQVMRLRRLYRCGTPAEIREAFPDRSASGIYSMAEYFGIKRPRKPFVRTGFLIIDQIRDKCFECALSMADLDALAGTGTYFAKAGWLSGSVKMRAIRKAVETLGGQLTVKWDDPPNDVAAVSPMPQLMPGGRLPPSSKTRIAA